MGIVQDCIDAQARKAYKRMRWESTWRVIDDYGLPEQVAYTAGLTSQPAASKGLNAGPMSVDRGRKLYDATSVWAVDRLTAGMEALVSPQSEKWHDLVPSDLFGDASETEEEADWTESTRDYLFGVRYDPRSGFTLANQKAMRSLVARGTSVMFLEAGTNTAQQRIAEVPFLYRTISLFENFLDVDANDVVNSNHRVFSLSARQAIKWIEMRGGTAHEALTAAAQSVKDADRQFTFMHCVQPRDERGTAGSTNRDSAFSSYYIDVDNKHLVRQGGYFDFPYIVQWWQQQEGSPYGESPVMLALADIVMLQQMTKQTLRASQQMTNPPLGLPNKGIMNRADLNPRALNYGAVDKAGNLLVKPIVTAQNLPFAMEILKMKGDQVRESLYINLFQILIQNPDMTATEALIRANEKGELLSPAGSKIQDGYSRMVDRELSILIRLGAFEPGARMAIPESLQGRTTKARMASPLDRLRRANELTAADRVFARAGDLAARGKPEVLDLLDEDEYILLSQEIEGAPRRILRSEDDVAARRAQRQQQLQEQAALATAQQVAETAEKGVPAAAGAIELAQSGGLDQLAAAAPAGNA